jgi:lysozyme
MKMKTSKNGREFISGHEGNPLTAYLDPVGIPTIGHGFTMRSPQVRQELAKLGIKKLVPGKTKITAKQSDDIFAAVLEKEFEPVVNNQMPENRTVKPNMFDAMISATWNLGPKFMGWRWIRPWRDNGNVSESARIWSESYNTAGGRKLPGLVRRRKEEALLFEQGVYTGVKEGTPRKPTKEPPLMPDGLTKEAQEILKSLGWDIKVDGWFGEKTKEAILEYQKNHPHLKNDGILGPATIAQLRRDVLAKKQAVTETLGVSIPSGFAAFFTGLPWYWIMLGVATIILLYFAWRYRDVLQRRYNNWRGIEVEV